MIANTEQILITDNKSNQLYESTIANTCLFYTGKHQMQQLLKPVNYFRGFFKQKSKKDGDY
jgi:hypothetical protein